jgi:hypothetical protein
LVLKYRFWRAISPLFFYFGGRGRDYGTFNIKCKLFSRHLDDVRHEEKREM